MALGTLVILSLIDLIDHQPRPSTPSPKPVPGAPKQGGSYNFTRPIWWTFWIFLQREERKTRSAFEPCHNEEKIGKQ